MLRKALIVFPLALLLVFSLLLVGGCAGTSRAADTAPDSNVLKNSITVSGEGKVYAPSDEASLSFAVRTVTSTASRAMNENSETMDKVIAALRSKGLTDEEVKTGNISLYPQQEWREGRAPKIISYTAENRIVVRTKKLDRLGEIIDASTTAGATEVSELRFQLSEDNKAQQDALKIAVRNSRGKADALAKEMGLSAGKAIMISEGVQPAPIVPLYNSDLGMRSIDSIKEKAMAPAVMPQDILVIANVTVSFEMR